MAGLMRGLYGAAKEAPILRNLQANQPVKDAFEGLGVASSNSGAASKMHGIIARGDMDKAHEVIAERAVKLDELKSANKIKKAERYHSETASMQEMLNASGMKGKTGKLEQDEINAARKAMAGTKGEYQKQSDKAVRNAYDKTKDYFWDDDMGVRATRIGAAVAGGAGLAVGTRALTGGSATHNNQGKRDIAGIPFV